MLKSNLGYFLKKIDNSTVVQKAFVLATVITVFLIVNAAFIFTYSYNQDGDAILTDIAGRQRMLSQKIPYLTLRLIQGEDNLRPQIISLTKLYSDSLNILKFGGDPKTVDRNYDRILPPSPENITIEIDEAKNLWVDFEFNIDKILNAIQAVPRDNETINNSWNFITSNSELLFTKSDNIVQSFVRTDLQKRQVLDYIVLTFTLIGIILVFIAYFVIKIYVSPVQKLNQFTREFTKTNEYKELPRIYRDDEIGQLTKSINILVEKIVNVYKDLQHQVEQKTSEIANSNRDLEVKITERTKELQETKKNLEKKVEQRTKDLDSKVNELEQINNMLLDRELKMIELKKELDALKSQSN